jgi:hypothetical protein
VLIQRDDPAGNDAVRSNTAPVKANLNEDACNPVPGATDRATEKAEASNEVNSGVQSAISSPAVGTSTKQHDPRQQGSTQSSSTASKVASGDGFHVFTWLNTYATTGPVQETQSSKDARISADLEEMNHFLGHQTNQDERRTYQACPQRKRQEILDVLAVGTIDAGSLKESKIDLFNAAESVFEGFLPLHFDGPTVGKYWGALYRLLTVSVFSKIT